MFEVQGLLAIAYVVTKSNMADRNSFLAPLQTRPVDGLYRVHRPARQVPAQQQHRVGCQEGEPLL